ncbi:MAG: efflux RND transporter periplasmic adaptor subunit [Crocinitomicaceae bacterium]
MKKVIVFFTLMLVIVSCGQPESTPLEKLKITKDSLKLALAKVNAEITKLDTTKKEVVLLVTSTEVMKKNFQHKIELQGAVETDQNILINSEASGVIRKISVKEGQRVSRGQTLITIDAEILQNNIEELNTSLEMANYMYDKQMSLNEKGLGTEIELESAKNQKKSLESKLRTLQSQRGKSVVRAPFSGVIDEIFTNVGEMASPQAPLIRLVNNKNIKVTAGVSESYLGQVELGTPVDIYFPNQPDKTIASKVSYMGSFVDPVNRTFRIHVAMKNNTMFLPNQLAKIKITDLNIDSALVVNSQAILQDTDNNNYVYKMTSENGSKSMFRIQKVYVNLVKSYENESAIEPLESGILTDESIIVLDGGKGVTDNDIVKVQ